MTNTIKTNYDDACTRVRDAIAVLIDHREWICDASRGWRGVALESVIREWDTVAAETDVWQGAAELVRTRDRFDNDLNAAAARLLAAAFDAYSEEADEGGLTVGTLTTMQEASMDIARTVARAADKYSGRSEYVGSAENVQDLASALGGMAATLGELAARLPRMVAAE